MSNAYPTCPPLGDNLAKVRLIPNDIPRRHPNGIKDVSVMEGDASDELVGGVTALQGYDQ